LATWIGHLRIAEKLLDQIPSLNEEGFTLGNLGPDSGVPNADWSEFDPPKEVTHFLRTGGGEDKIHDLEFYHSYLQKTSPDGSFTYSYSLGYFFHLICDNLWTRRVWYTAKHQFAEEFSQNGKQYIWELKKDWYDLDHKYVRDNKASLFWRVLMPAPNPPALLPFLSEHAMHHSLDYIRHFYSQPDPTANLDRAYPHLNEYTMSRYVGDAVVAILAIQRSLAENPDLSKFTSAVSLLPEADLAPYAAPLGDAT
jgi:hypothetical protein